METDHITNLYDRVSEMQQCLREAGIESMLIGGLANLVWGKTRFTKDADLKVLLQRDQAEQLFKALSVGYQFLADDPLAMLQQMGFVFVQDQSGLRIDMLLAEMGFDLQAMARAVPISPLPNVPLMVCSPEDLIIYKMISTRARDHEDAQGVLRRQKKKLDHAYIEDWLGQFETALDDSTLLHTYRQMRKLNE